VSHDKKTTSPTSGGGAAPAGGVSQPCPPDPPPTVKIIPEFPVACPGHPLRLTAVGDPGGGSYAWTLSGAGELVDGGGAAANTGNIVFLRCFKPDDSNGNIPEHTATAKVTYTHPHGTATDTKNIPIHKIDFTVTNMTVTAGVTQANERTSGVSLGNAGGVATMSTTPSVQITLAANCPRKTDCARNHRAAFLQTVLTNERRLRFTHSEFQLNVNLPIRDQIDGPVPFYHRYYDDGSLGVVRFDSDGDTAEVHHEDSPMHSSPWRDPRPGAPAPPPSKNGKLRQIFFSNGFRAWLVVQNIEWADHDLPGSFAYLRNYDWSMQLNVTVDTTKAVGNRCSPRSNPPTIGPVGTGKGANSPNLDAPYPNRDHTLKVDPAPGI
jgi:hypothetical protein